MAQLTIKNGKPIMVGSADKPGHIEHCNVGQYHPEDGKFKDVTAEDVSCEDIACANLAPTGTVSGAGITGVFAAPPDLGTTTPAKVEGTYISQNKYYWADDFDDEAATVQLEAGLNADFYTTAGVNYAGANVTYTAGPGGTLEAKCANADNDSVTILGLLNFNTSLAPIMEARIKIDDKATASFFVGFSAAAFNDKATIADNCFLVGLDSDNAHTFGAAQLIAASNNDAAGGVIDDMGVAVVNDTYLTIKIDLTTITQPRVWVNGTEVAAATITGTVKAATAVAPYLHVQNLAGGLIQRVITVDYIKCWQTRG